ncbi:hypothetical protein E1281_06525 [Actinomadura sp. KC345]|uniref:hypothetical protein n=1 Tax=Actinomadura sp. KC345 TaxID=2530371 RepID=UPI001047D1D6|nr:hypothetical protein [Actinomadura sp. KC345]TDC56777.1 hypothetical protein E1281_06525 [Actinomadura sp. KC345]
MTWENTPRLVLSAGDRSGDAEAVVDGPLRLTFAELAGRVAAAAGTFRAQGIGKGDRYLAVNPFSDVFGYKAGCTASMICGATILPCLWSRSAGSAGSRPSG